MSINIPPEQYVPWRGELAYKDGAGNVWLIQALPDGIHWGAQRMPVNPQAGGKISFSLLNLLALLDRSAERPEVGK